MKRVSPIVFILVLLFSALPILCAGGSKEEGPLTEKEKTEQRLARRQEVIDELKDFEEKEETELPIQLKAVDKDREEAETGRDTSTASPVTLTVDDAVALAEESNLTLWSEEIGVKIKKRKMDNAFNVFYPSLRISGTLSHLNEKPSPGSSLIPNPASEIIPGSGIYDEVLQFTVPESDIPDWNISAQFSSSLMIMAGNFMNIKQTVLDYQSGKLSQEKAKKQLELDIRKQFYELLLFEENIQIMKEDIAAAKDRYEQAEANYENGLVAEYSMLSARVAWENLKPALTEMQNGYESMLMAFKNLLGMDLQLKVTLSGSIEPDPMEFEAGKLITEYLSENLEIQSMVHTIKTLEHNKQTTILSSFTPYLQLMFNFSPQFQLDAFRDPWFEDLDNWSDKGMFSITLGMNLDPLLPKSSAWTGIHELEDSITQTQNGLAQAIQGTEMQIETTVKNLEKSLQQIETLGLNVQLAERAYNMAKEAYDAGNKELLEVQNAELELKKAKVKVLEEKKKYKISLLDLEYTLNTPIEELAKTGKED